MKFLFLYFTTLFATSANAQNPDSLKADIEKLLALKHFYEATLHSYEVSSEISKLKREPILLTVSNINKQSFIKKMEKKNVDIAFAGYIEAINVIKQKEKQYALFLQDELDGKDSSILTKKFVEYDYVSPLSSIYKKDNLISKLEYYKILSYFILNLNRDILPTLEEALWFLKE